MENELSSHIFSNLTITLVPLLVILAYQSRMKLLVGALESIIMICFLFAFPGMYNLFIYNSTSTFDYIWALSGFSTILFAFTMSILGQISAKKMREKLKEEFKEEFEDKLANEDKEIRKNIISQIREAKNRWISSFGGLRWFIFILLIFHAPSYYSFALFWVKKDNIAERIGYTGYLVISTILIILPSILFLFGRIYTALYTYLLFSVSFSFSIAYSNNIFFTDLILAVMIYLLGRMFDKEVLVGMSLHNLDNNLIITFGDKYSLKKLTFYDQYYYRRSEKEIELADEKTYNELVEQIKNSEVRSSELV